MDCIKSRYRFEKNNSAKTTSSTTTATATEEVTTKSNSLKRKQENRREILKLVLETEESDIHLEPFHLHRYRFGYAIHDTHNRLNDIEHRASKEEVKFLSKPRRVFVQVRNEHLAFTERPFINDFVVNNEGDLIELEGKLGERLSFKNIDHFVDAYYLLALVNKVKPEIPKDRAVELVMEYVTYALWRVKKFYTKLAYLQCCLWRFDEQAYPDAHHMDLVLQEIISDRTARREDLDTALSVLKESLISKQHTTA
jgi:hypothetical protein